MTRLNFDKKYMRVMEGEAYTDPIKTKRLANIESTKKNITSKPFMKTNFSKKSSGLGNNYGTFSGKHEHFSPVTREGKSYKSPGRNFTTNPGKKGTGFGYNGLTFQKYPDHSVEKYGNL